MYVPSYSASFTASRIAGTTCKVTVDHDIDILQLLVIYMYFKNTTGSPLISVYLKVLHMCIKKLFLLQS